MKKFYLIILILAALYLLFINVATIMLPREYFVAITLEREQPKWDISLKDDLKKLINYDVKKELVKFIKENESNYTGTKEANIFCFTVIIFSLVGYIRERKKNP